MKKIGKALVLFFLSLILAQLLGIFGIIYPHWVNNDPLLNPIQVTAIAGMTLKTSDNRVFTVQEVMDPAALEFYIKRSNYRIDIEESRNSSEVNIYVKRPNVKCFFGWPWIIIPIIPCNIPANHRGLLVVAVQQTLD